jgi:hypothetical protein
MILSGQNSLDAMTLDQELPSLSYPHVNKLSSAQWHPHVTGMPSHEDQKDRPEGTLGRRRTIEQRKQQQQVPLAQE